MRVAQVSGHYPPNFVSGGTLVPQRLARAVAQSGHESFVFAGKLDSAVPCLATSIETDESGVEITWIATTPWTGWADRHNFDNPGVAAAFREWMMLRRPDVVHFHSIQTLGAGLLKVAHEAGARVIVTMHDFWWFCARQFLVDSSMTPCSLVTDCGVCGCESGAEIRIERDGFLRDQLRYADVILAPSTIAKDVFIANGVDPHRIRVDENGVEVPTLTAKRPRDEVDPSAPLRLYYVGGPQPLKGWLALRAAAEDIGEIDGILLDAYGVTEEDTHGMPSWVRPCDPYDRRSVDRVLSTHDFLVLPSIMRESHSIATREALAAGLAVVCTDTLGPEEAVAHGVNGLIVPAGNSGALAQTLRDLAADHSAARLLMRRGSISPILTIQEQTDRNLALYREMTTPPPTLRSKLPPRISQVLFIVGIEGAPLRYRVRLPAEALSLHGIRSDVVSYRDPLLPELAAKADAVVLYRVPATNQILEVIARIKERQTVPVLFDVDDLIFDPTLRGRLDGLDGLTRDEDELWWRGVARYRTTMEACDAFIGSTEGLCESATSLTGMRSYRFPNGVGELLARQSDAAVRRPRSPGPLRIGYFSGTTTHDADWALIEQAIITALYRHRDAELWVGGHVTPTPALARLGSRVRHIPFSPWYELPAILRDTDICIAPLTSNGPFNEAKSAIKWLEAALVATPTIATPTQPFREVIASGNTGLLASNPEEWTGAFDLLLGSETERSRIGSMARRSALLGYSPSIQGERYKAILSTATADLRTHGHRTASTWIDVVDDERFDNEWAHLESYSVPSPPRSTTLSARFRQTARQLMNTATNEGAVGLVERGATSAIEAVGHLSRVALDEGAIGIARRASHRLR